MDFLDPMGISQYRITKDKLGDRWGEFSIAISAEREIQFVRVIPYRRRRPSARASIGSTRRSPRTASKPRSAETIVAIPCSAQTAA